MKAFLLAAGYGTRLKPITDKIPKCLVPIHGQPLLGWWLDLFQKYGIREVLINTHYLAEQVEDYLKEYRKKNINIVIETYYEKTLLGSGGTIREKFDFIGDDSEFLVCYADNLTDVDLNELIRFHKSKKDALLTMALFRTNLPKQCGIAELDDDSKVVTFVEKPEEPKGNLANAGIYVLDRKVRDYLGKKSVLDFGNHVIPDVVASGKTYGHEIGGYLRDIGTIANYELAKKEWKYDYHQNSSEN